MLMDIQFMSCPIPSLDPSSPPRMRLHFSPKSVSSESLVSAGILKRRHETHRRGRLLLTCGFDFPSPFKGSSWPRKHRTSLLCVALSIFLHTRVACFELSIVKG
jgi:hypothetical protein